MIPAAALAHHIAILGKTGAGKTTAAKTAVETLLDEKRRVCVIDPTGAWYGLRLGPDGQSPGYPVVIFGGDHADIPITDESGPKLAELVAKGQFSCVIDTSNMTVGARTRLFTGFAESLFRVNRAPLHLIIDEAHMFAPQGRVSDPQSGKMLHAANNLVSGGRSRGLRIIMISQRPAKLHKDSLTQVETLIAMRLIAPQDRAAVEAWIGEWADPKKGAEVIASLPSLKVGEGWIWSPEIEVLQKVKFPPIRTFDSSRAPEDLDDAEGYMPPIFEGGTLAGINLDELRASLSSPSNEVEKSNTPIEAVRKAAYDDGYKTGFDHGLREGCQCGGDVLFVCQKDMEVAFQKARDALEQKRADRAESGAIVSLKASESQKGPSQSKADAQSDALGSVFPKPLSKYAQKPAKDANGLDAAATKLLEAFRRYPALTFEEACIVAGMMPGNGYFYGGKKRLIAGGFLNERDGRFAVVGANGRPTFRPVTRDEILSTWSKLKQPAPIMLRKLLALGKGGTMSVDQLAQLTGLKPGNGYWYGGIKLLRNANLIEDQKGSIRLSEFVLQAK